jgi:murein DD-endopeptidase MepM/ murein hydrolase activator NlpD
LGSVVFLDQEYPLYKITDNKFGFLSGFDLDDKEGEYKLKISVEGKNNNQEEREIVIDLKERKSKEQRLTLPDNLAVFSEIEVKKIEDENNSLNGLFKNQNSPKYWDSKFLYPLQGKNKNNFGVKRFINGEERSRHNGVDIGAKCGAKILAPATGKVILCDDFFLAGKGLVIDHGLGLYSMYFHLSKFGNKCNDLIKKGEIVGYVGKTGRATGCHLHWAVRVRNAKIDPDALMNLPTL